MSDTMTSKLARHEVAGGTPPRVVLVLQGGGALGAYQGGVYQALDEAGLGPDWMIGTSIGAMNAAVLAGNPAERRLARLRELWRRLAYGAGARLATQVPGVGQALATWMTMADGLGSFFRPNPLALNLFYPLGAERAGLYRVDPLRETLADLIDFAPINAGETRLTVGAANVRTAEMHYFDSRDMPLDLRHILASGALPPAFPPVRIDGDLYWDGGILSNTPIEAVFDDNPRRSALVFAVHLWNPNGTEPTTIAETMNRQKEVQYASRATSHIKRQQQLHHLRHIIAELAAHLPAEERESGAVRALASWGCLTQMHVVRLLAPPLAAEDHTRDIDFNPVNIEARWQAGYDNTRRVIEAAPWRQPCDPSEGFILHEARDGRMVA